MPVADRADTPDGQAPLELAVSSNRVDLKAPFAPIGRKKQFFGLDQQDRRPGV